jgi:4-amino-4-deoxy-L-arabinose transferase-like glycosyltransferase
MTTSRSLIINLSIILIGSLLFIPYLGHVHLFDWDEANFAESAREMIVSNNYFNVQINFDIFWEKPPLFIWMQVLSMKVFGINEFAARFPNAIIGIITLLVLFNIGKKEFDEKFGLFWVLAYAGSILPHFYFKSGIIDPTFNLFIFLGLYNIIKLTDVEIKKNSERLRKATWAGVFIGLAVLTKGPVAYLIVALCILSYFVVKRSFNVIKFKELFIYSLLVLIFSFAWFGVGIVKDGLYFIVRFVEYQLALFSTEESGHGGPFYYHIVVLLVGCFPASIYVFKSFIRQYSDSYPQRNMKIWMMISLCVVLILFTIVKTKIVHYSSFCYFPITFLAAYSLHKVSKHRTYFMRIFQWWFLILGGLISIVLIAFPLLMKYRFDLMSKLKEYIHDDFALASLKAPVNWTGLEISVGCFYLAAIILATFYHYKDPIKGAIILFVSSLLMVQFVMYLIVPKIEKHTQATAIEFYKSVKGKDVYVESVGFKSYADMFYADERPENKSMNEKEGLLLNGKISKPAYLIRKVGSHNEVEEIPELKKLGEQNGFVYYVREPK